MVINLNFPMITATSRIIIDAKFCSENIFSCLVVNIIHGDFTMISIFCSGGAINEIGPADIGR